jgi:hypothetical protein
LALQNTERPDLPAENRISEPKFLLIVHHLTAHPLVAAKHGTNQKEKSVSERRKLENHTSDDTITQTDSGNMGRS